MAEHKTDPRLPADQQHFVVEGELSALEARLDGSYAKYALMEGLMKLNDQLVKLNDQPLDFELANLPEIQVDTGRFEILLEYNGTENALILSLHKPETLGTAAPELYPLTLNGDRLLGSQDSFNLLRDDLSSDAHASGTLAEEIEPGRFKFLMRDPHGDVRLSFLPSK